MFQLGPIFSTIIRLWRKANWHAIFSHHPGRSDSLQLHRCTPQGAPPRAPRPSGRLAGFNRTRISACNRSSIMSMQFDLHLGLLYHYLNFPFERYSQVDWPPPNRTVARHNHGTTFWIIGAMAAAASLTEMLENGAPRARLPR